jgi:hypothetical protein
LNRGRGAGDDSMQLPISHVRRIAMFTTISVHRSNRQVGDLDLIVTLALTAVGLAITALAFAFGFGAEFGQILAIAG